MKTLPATINEKRTEIVIEHEGKPLVFERFEFPLSGYNRFSDLVELLGDEAEYLGFPTPSEVLSLDSGIRAAGNENYIREIQKIWGKEYGTGVTTSTCAFGVEGETDAAVLVADFLTLRDMDDFLDGHEISDYGKFLDVNDLNTASNKRFLPARFRTGELTHSQVVRNSFLRGVFGTEGIKKVSQRLRAGVDGQFLFYLDPCLQFQKKASSRIDTWRNLPIGTNYGLRGAGRKMAFAGGEQKYLVRRDI